MFSLKDKRKSSNGATIAHYKKAIPSSFDYTMLPKKIIKANMSYSTQHLHELSFEKGDFFHVVGRENDRHWYAVNNPLTNISGLVPVHCFDVMDKIPRTLSVIQPALPLDHPSVQKDSKRIISSPSSPPRHCYGIVLYDFIAEGPDELDCKANETIMVISQANSEWYVCKPISRLGKHGLVPISFIELRDITTHLPISSFDNNGSSHFQVNSYRKTSRFSVSSSLSDQHDSLLVSQRHERRQQLALPISSPDPQSRHSFEPTATYSSFRLNSSFITIKNRKSKLQEHSPRISMDSITKVVHITVNSFVWERGQYWFVLYVTVDNGRHRILYRTYEDFYQFHLRSQQEYPENRQLPWIPEPLEKMDDLITEQRREELDDYCKRSLAGPLSQSIQQQLFGLKQGDVETDYAPRKGSRVIKTVKVIPPPPPSSSPTPTPTTTMVKIKIVHQDDIFAVKLPANTTLPELKLRIKERLGDGGGDRYMYKDEIHGTILPLDTEMDMEDAFSLAIQRGKLTVVVD